MLSALLLVAAVVQDGPGGTCAGIVGCFQTSAPCRNSRGTLERRINDRIDSILADNQLHLEDAKAGIALTYFARSVGPASGKYFIRIDLSSAPVSWNPSAACHATVSAQLVLQAGGKSVLDEAALAVRLALRKLVAA